MALAAFRSIVNNTCRRGPGLMVAAVVCLAMALSAASSGQDTVMVLRTSGNAFDQAVQGLKEELSSQYQFREVYVDKLDSQSVLKILTTSPPALAILMDNRAIALYWQYQQTIKDTSRIPPSISLMGVFLDCYYPELMRNGAIITYEVPIVTSVVGLRSALGISVNRVGVIYREFLTSSIDRNAEYCKQENITLARLVVPHDADASKAREIVKNGLKQLYKGDKIDAFWVPNDNVLLTRDMIFDVLVPLINRYKKPVIVGVNTLVQPELHFGTFAVLPDHVAMGVQAADMVRDAAANNWHFPLGKAIPPVSVYKIVNLQQAIEFCHIKKESLKTVDQILEPH